MKIKEITIQKTRTISVDGIMGREKYRKIEIRLVGDVDKDETLEQANKKITTILDKAMSDEIIKINKEVTHYKKTKL